MYRPVDVHPALRGLVHGIAAYDETGAAPVVRRQAPVGSCPLIVGVHGVLRLDGPAGTSTSGAFLAGLQSGPVTTMFTGRQAGVQVDLHPLALVRLLGPGEVTDRVPALDALGVEPFADLAERLRDDATWSDRLDRTQATLAALLTAPGRRVDPEVTWAWRRLAAGGVRVSALAAEVGWSRRHLLARFRAQVGVPPTLAGRILRFRRAADLLVPGTGPDRRPAAVRIADVAATAGYADHSHLVREFRDLAGCTPGTYLAEHLPEVQDDVGPGA